MHSNSSGPADKAGAGAPAMSFSKTTGPAALFFVAARLRGEVSCLDMAVFTCNEVYCFLAYTASIECTQIKLKACPLAALYLEPIS